MNPPDLSVILPHLCSLDLWQGPIEPLPLSGGLSNINFLIEDQGERYVARIGGDVPVHHVMRFNEQQASQAAFAAGLGPEIVYREPHILVMRYIEAQPLTAKELAAPQMIERVAALIKRCHTDMVRYLQGPVLAFWVFHALRNYMTILGKSHHRHHHRLSEWAARADILEQAVKPVELVFGHNDLLAANILDDGQRLWLIDWEYAGFTHALFDLAGVASHHHFTPSQRDHLLAAYADAAYADDPITDHSRWCLAAMGCASLLRESLWSLVSELHAHLDIDYVAYSERYIRLFEEGLGRF